MYSSASPRITSPIAPSYRRKKARKALEAATPDAKARLRANLFNASAARVKKPPSLNNTGREKNKNVPDDAGPRKAGKTSATSKAGGVNPEVLDSLKKKNASDTTGPRKAGKTSATSKAGGANPGALDPLLSDSDEDASEEENVTMTSSLGIHEDTMINLKQKSLPFFQDGDESSKQPTKSLAGLKMTAIVVDWWRGVATSFQGMLLSGCKLSGST